MKPLRALAIALIFLVAVAAVSGCTRDSDVEQHERPTTSAEGEAPSQRARPTGSDEASEPSADVEVVPPLDGPPGPTVVITSGIRGYTEPCGCTESLQLGGIDRLVHVVLERSRGKDAIVLDAGDLFFQQPKIEPERRDQELARAHVIAQAARRMDVAATTVGAFDLAAGVDAYRELIEQSGATLVSSNATEALRARTDAKTIVERSIGDLRLAVLGMTDPASLPEDERGWFRPLDASVVPEELASGRFDVVILLYQGTAQSAQRTLRRLGKPRVDFIAIGQNAEAGDGVTNIAGVAGLEVYSQAREVGALRLYAAAGQHRAADEPEDGDGEGDDVGESGHGARWHSAEESSVLDRDALQAQLERVESQIAALRERLDGAGSPLLERLEARADEYRSELSQSSDTGTSEASGERSTFRWSTTPVSPQFARDAEVETLRRAFNRSLRAINLAHASAPPSAAEGASHYAGDTTCASCHPAAQAVWDQTAHATAIDTLDARDKRFDTACIGCHVTGYERPGGSSLGHLDGLENVQCESCHGPASQHAQDPANSTVPATVEESTCRGCHTPEHSPEFDDATYRPRILGVGHGR